jgi:hypothetical protein
VRGHSVANVWHIKLKRVKKFLKGWAQNISGHQRKYKILLREETLKLEKLEEDDVLPAHLLSRKTCI